MVPCKEIDRKNLSNSDAASWKQTADLQVPAWNSVWWLCKVPGLSAGTHLHRCSEPWHQDPLLTLLLDYWAIELHMRIACRTRNENNRLSEVVVQG